MLRKENPTRVVVKFKEYEKRIGELMELSKAENIPVFVEGSSGKIVAVLYSGKVDLLEFGDDAECPLCNKDEGHDLDCPVEKRDRQQFEAGYKLAREVALDAAHRFLEKSTFKYGRFNPIPVAQLLLLDDHIKTELKWELEKHFAPPAAQPAEEVKS